jgi:hypothetical protein
METNLDISDRALRNLCVAAGAFVAANLIYWPALLLIGALR